MKHTARDSDDEEVDELMSTDDELDGHHKRSTQLEQDEPEDGDEGDDTIIEFQLNVLLECLNIFGTASGSGGMTAGLSSGSREGDSGKRRWSGGQRWRDDRDQHSGSETEGEGDGETSHRRRNRGKGKGRDDGNGKIENYFGEHKGTGMRLSYAGFGEPLVLLLCVQSPLICWVLSG